MAASYRDKHKRCGVYLLHGINHVRCKTCAHRLRKRLCSGASIASIMGIGISISSIGPQEELNVCASLLADQTSSIATPPSSPVPYCAARVHIPADSCKLRRDPCASQTKRGIHHSQISPSLRALLTAAVLLGASAWPAGCAHAL